MTTPQGRAWGVGPAARSASSTVKDSGWSRSGPHSMADFTELQWITTRDGAGAYRI